jgi:hypothetical protein
MPFFIKILFCNDKINKTDSDMKLNRRQNQAEITAKIPPTLRILSGLEANANRPTAPSSRTAARNWLTG